PYMRDTFVEHGIYIDTMETLVHWKDVQQVHQALTKNLKKSKAFNKEQGLFMAHISHVYPNAACMYFTLVTPMHRGQEIEQWHEIKELVSQTIVLNGGTISHHHSIGADHQKWYLRNADPVGLQVLKSIKKILDPNGILNPGKLFT
ncbi:MAG: FAD-binding oxidoreductase, partial [Bacteroidetes bacterium]|nr:FAD-binding oxidoreductase [Bacteroidota bacterium]